MREFYIFKNVKFMEKNVEIMDKFEEKNICGSI